MPAGWAGGAPTQNQPFWAPDFRLWIQAADPARRRVATDLRRQVGPGHRRARLRYALEGALLVRSLGTSGGAEFSITEWNTEDLWRQEYGNLTGDLCFFAEDLFGGQFAVDETKVVTFDPETGDVTGLAEDIYGWAGAIVADYRVLTAHPLARAWQEVHGPIPPGHRLMPVQPFSLGGEFHIDNLVPGSQRNRCGSGVHSRARCRASHRGQTSGFGSTGASEERARQTRTTQATRAHPADTAAGCKGGAALTCARTPGSHAPRSHHTSPAAAPPLGRLHC
jgi:hypothetical protein